MALITAERFARSNTSAIGVAQAGNVAARRLPFRFRRERLAVFVDGCFWHGCPAHWRKPDSNNGYWLPKLLRNKARDREESGASSPRVDRSQVLGTRPETRP
jgi:DNA mismatch endonuclease Vsr